jgi:hypothetical protein
MMVQQGTTITQNESAYRPFGPARGGTIHAPPAAARNGPRGGLFFLLILSAVLTLPLAAQDAEEGEGAGEGRPELPIESEWPDVMPDLYSRGDKIFVISAGAILPTLFIHEDGGVKDGKIGIGGVGSLAYTYFFNGHVFMGGELGGMFAPTKAKNYLFIVPMGLRFGYQFILGSFEFPLSLLIGFAPQTYLEKDYFGFFVKPLASAFWRFNPDWSFGLNAAWWWVPQWGERTVQGNFLELTLSARYHF